MLYEEIGLHYEYYNPNLFIDNRDHNDCIIRAFTKLVNKSWNEVFDDLYKIGKSIGFMMNSNQTIYDYATANDFIYCDDFHGLGTMMIGNFLSKIKNQRIECIVATYDHSFYFADNTIYDDGSVEESGIISDESKLILDSHLCDLVQWFIASNDNFSKISKILD